MAEDLVNTPKSLWAKMMPVIVCGSGLFSDGYLNGQPESSPSIYQFLAISLCKNEY